MTPVPDVDILVVDDNSPDGTADLAEKAGAELGHIEVLRRAGKDGLGEAYRAGFAVGHGPRATTSLVQMDADLSHDPAALPALLAADRRAAPTLAIGSRYVPGGSHARTGRWYRRALSKWGNRYAGGDARHPHPRRHVRLPRLPGRGAARDRLPGHRRQRLRVPDRGGLPLSKWGGPVQELPIEFTDRVRGTSKMSADIMAEEMVLVTWWGIRDRALKLWRLLPFARQA